MKNSRGFTLAELIGVITLLSAIILVSVPAIINTLRNVENKEYEKFKKLVVNAAELYLERNRNLYPDFNEVGDSIDITAETLINEGYLKSDLVDPINSNNISKYKVVAIYGQDETFEYQTLKRMTFAELVTTTDEVIRINACALSGSCQTGTKFAIKVNENDTYNFYVINDDGNKVTLIMDRNLGDNVAWINKEDYVTENTKDENPDECYSVCNDEGPITALNILKTRTNNWINISTFSYVLGNDSDEEGGEYTYPAITGEMVENVRGRLPKYSELTSTEIGCQLYNDNSCPLWLYENLSGTGDDNTEGYWTSTAHSTDETWAWSIYSGGYLDTLDNSNEGYSGLRPVITLYRNL